jgi:PAS domain S-box-containing protein|uniref:histidine kinase n=1 Tax=Desulfobacca acetoxidans TaxID=60893 RepID=A0A7C3WGC2_9BACT
MSRDPETIYIAIIVDRERAGCLPLALPYSVIGYPMVQVDFFKADRPAAARPGIQTLPESRPEAVTLGLLSPEVIGPPRPLAELDPKAYDLILDWQNRTASLRGAEWDNLVTGPGLPALEQVICQFYEIRQKIEVSSGILLNAADAIITIDENHRIIGYNYGAELIFGYPRREAIGQDLKIIIPPPYKDVHHEYVRRYLATREPRFIGKHVQLTAQRRDGREFPMSISFSVAEIRGNFYFTGIIRDITEYKQMEERLLHSERLAAVGNTITHIAHEIKNPLAIIGGFARQLLRSPGLAEKDRQKLAIITEEVSGLEAMIAEMRDFVRRPAPHKEKGDLEALLETTLDLFKESFAPRHILVRRVRETPIPPFSFDAHQLHQVLLNLIKNALEAMPKGGQLTVTSRVKDGQAEISITDTGEGMTPEVLAKIFQPYFTTKQKGTGLGLAICRNIIEEHGGRIFVESNPGQGSTFTIQIPLEEAPPA